MAAFVFFREMVGERGSYYLWSLRIWLCKSCNFVTSCKWDSITHDLCEFNFISLIILLQVVIVALENRMVLVSRVLASLFFTLLVCELKFPHFLINNSLFLVLINLLDPISFINFFSKQWGFIFVFEEFCVVDILGKHLFLHFFCYENVCFVFASIFFATIDGGVDIQS